MPKIDKNPNNSPKADSGEPVVGGKSTVVRVVGHGTVRISKKPLYVVGAIVLVVVLCGGALLVRQQAQQQRDAKAMALVDSLETKVGSENCADILKRLEVYKVSQLAESKTAYLRLQLDCAVSTNNLALTQRVGGQLEQEYTEAGDDEGAQYAKEVVESVQVQNETVEQDQKLEQKINEFKQKNPGASDASVL